MEEPHQFLLELVIDVTREVAAASQKSVGMARQLLGVLVHHMPRAPERSNVAVQPEPRHRLQFSHAFVSLDAERASPALQHCRLVALALIGVLPLFAHVSIVPQPLSAPFGVSRANRARQCHTAPPLSRAQMDTRVVARTRWPL